MNGASYLLKGHIYLHADAVVRDGSELTPDPCELGKGVYIPGGDPMHKHQGTLLVKVRDVGRYDRLHLRSSLHKIFMAWKIFVQYHV